MTLRYFSQDFSFLGKYFFYIIVKTTPAATINLTVSELSQSSGNPCCSKMNGKGVKIKVAIVILKKVISKTPIVGSRFSNLRTAPLINTIISEEAMGAAKFKDNAIIEEVVLISGSAFL